MLTSYNLLLAQASEVVLGQRWTYFMSVEAFLSFHLNQSRSHYEAMTIVNLDFFCFISLDEY